MKVILFGATGMVGQSVLGACLRDDAITEVLRAHCGADDDVVPVDHVATVTVDGDRATVGVVLLEGWRAPSLDLVTSVARHLESVSEIARFELTVAWTRDLRHNQPAGT